MKEQQTDFTEPSPWTRPGFLLAAVFIALVIAAAVTIAVWPSGDGPAATAPPPAGTQATGARPTAALPTAIPTRAPKGVTWKLVGQNAVPVSESAGPRTVADGIASGYERSPEGALIAAAQLAARAALSAGRPSWEPTVTKQFMPGPDRDRLLSALKAAPDTPAAPGELSPLAGYVYQAYTPDTAVIGLVYRAPSGSAPTYHVVTTTLMWSGDDWKMVPPPGGSWLAVNRQALDLTGVVAWGNR